MKDVVSRCPIEEADAGAERPVADAAALLSEGWTKRFSDLRRDNPAVLHRMLTLELRKLEQAGVVRRPAHPGYPLRVEYALTPRAPARSAD